MKTQTINSLKAFCEASHLNPTIIRAVVRQIGGWESFQQSAPDVCRGGIDGGFCGFTWNKDTVAFALHNLSSIRQLAQEQSSDFGTSTVAMIQGFGCFRNDKPSEDEIGAALYGSHRMGDALEHHCTVLNALAWYAGEEVCRSYCDLTDQS